MNVSELDSLRARLRKIFCRPIQLRHFVSHWWVVILLRVLALLQVENSAGMLYVELAWICKSR